ncbi:Putative serine/threonine-protein kinase, active [Septoria linicola]|uniref:Serine/threonine-protein kinase, active n=1 Tax=Septoria linicola TaxID=215465 RepID=A0A9Q9AHP8_9PEZI|nr:Putative serine/threonine-protein kinase, active [Septoria linicola]
MDPAVSRSQFAVWVFNATRDLLVGDGRSFDREALLAECHAAWDNRPVAVGMAMMAAINNFTVANERANDARKACVNFENVNPVKGDPSDPAVRNAMRENAILCRTVVDAYDALLPAINAADELFKTHQVSDFLELWAHQDRNVAEMERSRASKKRKKTNDALHDFFKQSDLAVEYDGEWSGVHMYTSGMNTTGLWVRHDGGGRVLDRVIRKLEWLKYHGWDDLAYWKPALGDEGNKIMPPEAYFTERMNMRSNDHFVALRSWNASQEEQTVEICTEFCGFGDVSALADRYTQANTPIPESFLWFLFSQMADACALMLDGWRYEVKLGLPQDQIVHRDIKPGNIFLAANGSAKFPGYPLAKLGDFGLAIETNTFEPKNPTVYARQRAGTRFYRAPEQVDSAAMETGKYQAWEVGDDDQLLAWTNVYAVGMTMYRLVRNQSFGGSCPFIAAPGGRGQSLRSFHPSYTDELIDLIERCVQRRPQDRILPNQLKQEILQYMLGHDYMSPALSGWQSISDPEHDLSLGIQTEAYAVGLALAA